MASNDDIAVKLMGDISGFQTAMTRAASTAQKSFDSIRKSTQQVSGAINALNGLTVIIGGGAIIKAADDYNVLQSRIKQATKETGDYIAVSRELQQASQKTGASLKDTVDVFQRLSLAAPALGASNQQLLQITKTVQQLGVMSGATTAGLSAGLMQFGQMLSGGVAHAEELNSLLENTPLIADKIAKGMGKTTGELRAMVIEGKITSREVFESLKGQSEAIAKEFEKIPKSIGQSMTALKESFSAALGEMAQKTGAIDAATKGLDLLSKNATLVTNSILGMSAGSAVFRVVTADVSALRIAFGKLAVYATSAWGAATLGTSLLVAGLIAVKDQQFILGGKTVTLTNLLIASWEKVGVPIWDLGKRAFKFLGDMAVTAFNLINAGIQNLIAGIPILVAQMQPLIGAVRDLFAMAGASKTFDHYAKGIESIGKGLGSAYNNAAKLPKDIIDRAAQIGKGPDASAVSATPLGTPKAAIDKAREKQLEKERKILKEFLQDEQARINLKRLELNYGNENLELHKTIGSLQDKLNRQLLPDELAKVKAIVTEREKIEAALAVQGVSKDHQESLRNLQLERDGLVAIQSAEETINGLRDQGIKLSSEQMDKIRAMASEYERQKAALETTKYIEGLKEAERVQKQILIYGEQEAAILEAQRQARKENKDISQEELDIIRQTIAAKSQATLDAASQKQLDDLRAKNELMRDSVNLSEEDAKILETMRDYLSANVGISQDKVNAMQKELEISKELTKNEKERKELKEFFADQEKSIEDAKANLIQDRYQKDLLQAQAKFKKQFGREMTPEEAQKNADNIGQKAFAEDAKRAQDIIKENRTEQQKYKDDLKEINDLYNKGLLSFGQYSVALKGISPYFKEWHSTVSEVSKVFSKGLGDWIDGSKKLSDVWKDMGKQLLKIAAQKLILNPIENMLTKIGDSLFPIAKPTGGGNVAGTSIFSGLPGLNNVIPGMKGLSPAIAGGPQVSSKDVSIAANNIYINGNQVAFSGGGGGAQSNGGTWPMLNAPPLMPINSPFSLGSSPGGMINQLARMMGAGQKNTGGGDRDIIESEYQRRKMTDGMDETGQKLKDLNYYLSDVNRGAKALGIQFLQPGQKMPKPNAAQDLESKKAAIEDRWYFLQGRGGKDIAGNKLQSLDFYTKDVNKGASALGMSFQQATNPLIQALMPLTNMLRGSGALGMMSGFLPGGMGGMLAGLAPMLQSVMGNGLISGLSNMLKSVFSGNLFSTLTGSIQKLFSGGILNGLSGLVSNIFGSNGGIFGGIINSVKSMFGGGGLGGLTNIFGDGGLFKTMFAPLSGLTSAFSGLGGLTKMTGQGGLFSTMFAPLQGAFSSLKGLGGLGNIFGGNGLFDVMTRPIRGYESGGRVLGGEPIITSEGGPELWWPDSAGTIYNNSQLEEMLFRSSLAWGSRGVDMDRTLSNNTGTPFYQLNNGADIKIPPDIAYEMEKKEAYDKAMISHTLSEYNGRYGSPPDTTKLIMFVKRPPSDLDEEARRYFAATLPLMAQSRLNVDKNDITGNAILSNKHISNQAFNQPGATFLWPEGDQKGRLLRQYPELQADPRLKSWADTSDFLTNRLWPQGIKGISFSYQSSGMTWGAGGSSIVQTGDGDYETRLAAGLAEGSHVPYTMNPRNNNDPRYFRTPGSSPGRSPNNVPDPSYAKYPQQAQRSGLPSGWGGGRDTRDRTVDGSQGLMAPNDPRINDDVRRSDLQYGDGSINGQRQQMRDRLNQFDPQTASDALAGIKNALGKILGPLFSPSGASPLQPIHGPMGGIFNGSAILRARGGGGDIHANTPYIMGEHGPEMVVSRAAATVIPNSRLGGGGGGAPRVTVNSYTSTPVAAQVHQGADGNIEIRLDEMLAAASQRGGRFQNSLRPRARVGR